MSFSLNHPGQIATPDAPWLGLRSFTEEAHDYFFGRRAELEDLYERVLDKPLSILFGPSGLGKSSLLQAALIPRLRAQGFLPVLVRFDHEPEAAPLEKQMLEHLREALASGGFETQMDKLSAALGEEGAKLQWDAAALLWLIFHDPSYGFLLLRGESTTDPLPRPVFLIDQFEEIFTLGERLGRRAISLTFREALSALVENRPPASLRVQLEKDDALVERIAYQAQHAHVLLSLREDFLHMLERWRRSMPSLMENRFELRMLSGPQAFEAVVRPGQLRLGAPPIIPDEVGQAVVRFVAGAEDDVPLPEIDAVPPLLSLVCAELNAQRVAAGEQQITRAQFEGQSDEILQSFYLRSFHLASYGGTLDDIFDAAIALEAMKRLIEDRLLSPDGYRESIAFDTISRDLSKAAAPAAAKAVLDEVVGRRLLTVEERGGVRRLELAHDVLAPIVKASRDERQEKEALAVAQRDRARAEAEMARTLKERNRLKRLALLASCLAVLALIGAILGWIGFKRAQEGRNQAVEATRRTQKGVQSAWEGLKILYDDYMEGTLANTIGIGETQRNALKSKLRDHLLSQSQELNKQQPDHRETIRYITRSLLDKGREAIADRESLRAQVALDEAAKWSVKEPLNSVTDAETHGEILLEQARVPANSGEDKKGVEIAALHLPKVRELSSKWPASWRLQYLVIRLENLQAIGSEGRPVFQKMVERLMPLIDRSDHDFEPVIWRGIIELNGYRSEGGFDRSTADYMLLKDLILWFHQQVFLSVVNNRSEQKSANLSKSLQTSSLQTSSSEAIPDNSSNRYTIAQREHAVTRFNDLIGFVALQFSKDNNKDTATIRRAILEELEVTMKVIEADLHRNTDVYAARGDLLNLQEESIKEGIATRSESELRAAKESHRLVSAVLGVGSSVAVVLGPAFKSYTTANATEAAKVAALAIAQRSAMDFSSLDVAGMETVLKNNDISQAVLALWSTKRDDPLLKLHAQMVQQFIRLYQEASLDIKVRLLDTMTAVSSPLVSEWYNAGQHDSVVSFYERTYTDLPIATLSRGDRNALVPELSYCIRSLLKTGRQSDGKVLLKATVALCDSILEGTPWDWFVHCAMIDLLFDVADILEEAGDRDGMNALRLEGWKQLVALYGADINVARFKVLPKRGEVPIQANVEETKFFNRFKGKKPGGVGSQIVAIPCDVNKSKVLVQFHVLAGKKGYQRLLDQFRWIKEYRGVDVSPDAQEFYRKLFAVSSTKEIDSYGLAILAYDYLCEMAWRKKIDSKETLPAGIAKPSDSWKLPLEYVAADRFLAEDIQLESYPESGPKTRTFKNNAEADANRVFSLAGFGREGEVIIRLSLVKGVDGYRKLLDQLRWIALQRGIFVQPDVRESFRKLNEMALENNVDFSELCYYVFKTEVDPKSKEKPAEGR